MSIYTNESNPAALKLIIAAKYGGKQVNIKIVNVNGELHHAKTFFLDTWIIIYCNFIDRSLQEPKHLPYYETDGGSVIFVPNAAVWLLFPASENSSVVTEWLEFESTILTPSLAHFFGSNSKNQNLKSTIFSCLDTLEKALGKNPYFSHVKFVYNVSDIILIVNF